MKIVLDLLLLAIIIGCMWSGYKKGLVMTVGSIIVIIISLFFGDLLSDTFSHEAVPVIQPFVSGYMEGNDGVINEVLTEVTGGTIVYSADDVLAQNPDIAEQLCKLSYTKMGIYESSAKTMTAEAIEAWHQGVGSLSSTLVTVMCEKLTYYVGFILFFAICVILLTVLGNITNLSFKIPYMNKLNNVGGAVGGFITGVMFCLLCAWMLKFLGLLIPQDELGLVARLFVSMNTYSGFLSV